MLNLVIKFKTLPWLLLKKLQKNTSKVADAIFISRSFPFRPNKAVNSRCLIHKCRDVIVVFAHKGPLSIDGANHELTRLHNGTRMVFSQTSPKLPPPPPLECPVGRRGSPIQSSIKRLWSLGSVVVVLVGKHSASSLCNLRKGGNLLSRLG